MDRFWRSTWSAKLVTRSWTWPAIIVTIGVALRAYRLAHTDLWYDESFTAWMVTLPILDMLRATAGDVHPPLWYIITKSTSTLLGSSEAALRLPSLLLGCNNLWLFYEIGLSLGLSRKTNLLALGLLAVSPFQIYYSQEARMYQLLQFGVLVTLLAILRRQWILFTLGGLLLLYTHNLGFLYLVTLDIVAFLVTLHDIRGPDQGPGREGSFGIMSPLALANEFIFWGFLPWGAVLLGQSANMGAGYWIQRVTFGEVLSTLTMLYWFKTPALATYHITFLTIGLTIFALWWSGYQIWKGQDKQMLTILLLTFIAPQAIAFLASQIWRPIYLYRPLIGVMPSLCWLVAYALNSQKRRLGAALVGLPLLALTLGSYYFDQDVQRLSVSTYTEMIRQQAQPGDVIFHANAGSYVLFHYYLPDMDNVVFRQENSLYDGLSDKTKEAMGMEQVTIEDLVIRSRRVWLIHAVNPTTSDYEEQTMESLLQTYPSRRIVTIESNELADVTIWLLDIGGAS